VTDPTDRAPAPPTKLAQQFVRYFGGFAVGVGLALVPALPLSVLFPNDLRPVLVSISAFVLGVIALAVQFVSSERLSRRLVRRLFVVALAAVAAGLVLLVPMYLSRVVTLEVPAAKQPTQRFVVGRERLDPPACPCPTAQNDKDCLQEYISTERISQCWTKSDLVYSQLLLLSGFVVVTTGFGAMIGALLLQGIAIRREQRQRRGRSSPSKPRRRRSPPPEAGASSG
jgi:hypothetical protein